VGGTPPKCPLEFWIVSVRTGATQDTVEISGGDAATIEAIRQYARREFVYTRTSNE
jgi:hypothetical protein